jgi:sec-independent protein translocase protein TatB
MFDVAPSELLIVAIVALVVIGPKDLPKAMRYVGQWVGKARAMARHFRSGIDTMMRDAEIEEMEQKWRAHNEAIMKAHPDVASAPDGVESPLMTPLPRQPSQAEPSTNVPVPSAPPPAAPPIAAQAPRQAE